MNDINQMIIDPTHSIKGALTELAKVIKPIAEETEQIMEIVRNSLLELALQLKEIQEHYLQFANKILRSADELNKNTSFSLVYEINISSCNIVKDNPSRAPPLRDKVELYLIILVIIALPIAYKWTKKLIEWLIFEFIKSITGF